MTLNEPLLLPPDSSEETRGRGVAEEDAHPHDVVDFRVVAAAGTRRGGGGQGIVVSTVMDETDDDDDDEKEISSSSQDTKDRERERSFAKCRIFAWLLQWVWMVVVFSTCDDEEQIMYLVVGHIALMMMPLLYHGKLVISLKSLLFRPSVCKNGRCGKTSSSVDDTTTTRNRPFKPCLMDFLPIGVSLSAYIITVFAEYDVYATFMGLLVLLFVSLLFGTYKLIRCMMAFKTKNSTSNDDDSGGGGDGGGEHERSKWEGIVSFCKSPFETFKQLENEYHVELESRMEDEEVELQAQTERYQKHLAKRLKNPKLPSLKPYKCLVLLWLLFIVPVVVRWLLGYQGITMVVNYILYTILGEGSGTQTVTDEERPIPLYLPRDSIRSQQHQHLRIHANNNDVVSASTSTLVETTTTPNWDPTTNKIECIGGKCKILQSLSPS